MTTTNHRPHRFFAMLATTVMAALATSCGGGGGGGGGGGAGRGAVAAAATGVRAVATARGAGGSLGQFLQVHVAVTRNDGTLLCQAVTDATAA